MRKWEETYCPKCDNEVIPDVVGYYGLDGYSDLLYCPLCQKYLDFFSLSKEEQGKVREYDARKEKERKIRKDAIEGVKSLSWWRRLFKKF